MIYHAQRIAFVLLTGLFLSACSQQPLKENTPEQEGFVHDASTIPDNWQLTAKLGIKSNTRNGSVTVSWKQQQEEYEIQLSGPLGQGKTKLTGNQDFITISRPNKEPILSAFPEQLFEDIFGWEFPLAHLQYWVRGLSSKAKVQEQQLNADGTLSTLTQEDWHIQYQRYLQTEQWLLPGKIQLNSHDSSQPKLTLIIRKWQVLP